MMIQLALAFGAGIASVFVYMFVMVRVRMMLWRRSARREELEHLRQVAYAPKPTTPFNTFCAAFTLTTILLALTKVRQS